jgi:hypothetical protein
MKKRVLTNLGFAVALFFLMLILYASFSFMGVSNKSIQSYVLENYQSVIILYNLKILGFYILTALIMTLFSYWLQLTSVKEIILLNLTFYGFSWIKGIKLFPQVFTEQLYSRGGILKFFQVMMTDSVPLWLIIILPAALLALVGLKKRIIRGPVFTLLLSILIFFPFYPPSAKVQRKEPPPFPNILILGSDSLRPDHISYNGYSRPTPNIDSILESGATCLNLHSSLARTFPSLYPPEHGIRHMFPTRNDRKKQWITMTDVLRKNNYTTAVISDFAGDIFSRIDYGFDRIHAPHFSVKTLIKQRSLEIHPIFLSLLLSPQGRMCFPILSEMAFVNDTPYLTKKTKSEINRATRQGRPFFIVSFYSTNHFPYCPPYPYYRKYSDPKYRGSHKYKKENLLSEYGGRKLQEEDIRQVISLYDSGIAVFDDQVGTIMSFLKRTGNMNHTIVIIMSDHGENLYESRYGMGHGDHLRGNFASRMVFSISSPAFSLGGIKTSATCRDIDIAPTILDMAGIQSPESFRGHTLLPLFKGEASGNALCYQETGIWFTPRILSIPGSVRIDYPDLTQLLEIDPFNDEIVLKEQYRFDVIHAKHRSLMDRRYKYIYMPGTEKVREEIYPTEKDQIPANRTGKKIFKFLYRDRLLNVFPKHLIRLGNGYIFETKIHPPHFLYQLPQPSPRTR